MKDKKSRSIIFAIAMVTLLILSSVGSLGVSTNIADESDIVKEANITKKGAAVCVKASSRSIVSPSILSKNSRLQTLDTSSSSDSENILVAGELEDESYPSMVVSGLDALVAYEYEKNDGTHVYIRI